MVQILTQAYSAFRINYQFIQAWSQLSGSLVAHLHSSHLCIVKCRFMWVWYDHKNIRPFRKPIDEQYRKLICTQEDDNGSCVTICSKGVETRGEDSIFKLKAFTSFIIKQCTWRKLWTNSLWWLTIAIQGLWTIKTLCVCVCYLLGQSEGTAKLFSIIVARQHLHPSVDDLGNKGKLSEAKVPLLLHRTWSARGGGAI